MRKKQRETVMRRGFPVNNFKSEQEKGDITAIRTEESETILGEHKKNPLLDKQETQYLHLPVNFAPFLLYRIYDW